MSKIQKRIGIVVLTAFIIFQSIQIISKRNKIVTARKVKRAIISEKKSSDSLENVTGIRHLKQGDVFAPEDKSFSLLLVTDLDLQKSLLSDKILFLGKTKDSVEVSVHKISVNDVGNAALVEQWMIYENEQLLKGSASVKYHPGDNYNPEKDPLIFEITSKDRRYSGVIRLKRIGANMYIVKAVGPARNWAKYKTGFINSFSYYFYTKDTM